MLLVKYFGQRQKIKTLIETVQYVSALLSEQYLLNDLAPTRYEKYIFVSTKLDKSLLL